MLNLSPVVLSPDVEHENARDEQERHHKDGDGATGSEEREQDENGYTSFNAFGEGLVYLHLDSGGVVGVEPPHSTGAGSSSPSGGARRRGRRLALTDAAAGRTAGAGRAGRGLGGAGTDLGGAGCGSALQER